MDKTKRKALIIGAVLLLLILGGAGFFAHRIFSRPVQHEELLYQDKTYYSTALLQPNTVLDDKTETLSFPNAKLLEKKTEKDMEIWSFNSVPAQKVLVTKTSGNSYSTWTSTKLDTAEEAFKFLEPRYLQYRVYDDNGENSVLKKMSKDNQEKLIKGLTELIQTKAQKSLFSNLTKKDGYISTKEIYLALDEKEDVLIQPSLVKKSDTTYLQFSGDDTFSYWKVSDDLLNLLK